MTEDTTISYENYKKKWIEEHVMYSTNSIEPSDVEKGNRFGIGLTYSYFNFNDETKGFKSDGTGDGGIDFAFIDENNIDGGRTFNIIQSKYGTSYKGINSIVEELNKFFDTIIGNNRLSSNSGKIINKLKSFIDGNLKDSDKILYTLETTDKISEKEERILQRQKLQFQNIFKNKINFEVQSISLYTLYNKLDDIDTRKFKLKICTNILSSGKNEYLCFISLKDYYKFIKDYMFIDNDITRLYSKNVRGYLGAKNSKANKNGKIIKTLNEEANYFASFNNGIVMVVEEIKKEDDGSYILTEPYVVNGCQTSSCIQESLSDKYPTEQDFLSHTKNDEIYKNSFVVLKIIRVEDNNLLSRITRYANTQNRVTEKDLVGLDNKSPILQTIKRKMFEDNKIFVEIQGGSWNLKGLENKQKIYTGGNTSIHELLKIYTAALLGKCGMANKQNLPQTPPEDISSNKKDKKDNNVYSVIINYNEFNIADAYACFKLSELGKKYCGKNNKESSRIGTKFLYYSIFIEVLKRICGEKSIYEENYNEYFFDEDFRNDKVDNNKIITIKNKNKKIINIVVKLFEEKNKDILNYINEISLLILDSYIPKNKEEGEEYSIYYEKDMERNEVSRFLKRDSCNSRAEKLIIQINTKISRLKEDKSKFNEISNRLKEFKE